MGATNRVAVLPGDGIVVRTGDCVVVIGGVSNVPADVVDQLIDTIRDSSGEERVRRLAMAVLDADDPPELGVATLGAETASVFLYGEIDLRWPTGRARGTDHVLGVTETVSIVDGFDVVAGGAGVPLGSRSWNDLEAGAVPGAGVAVGPAAEGGGGPAVTPAESEDDETSDLPETPPEPVAEGLPPPSFESILLTEGADLTGRSPLPIAGAGADAPDETPSPRRPAYEAPVQVLGVYSPRGFFNHPEAKYCSRTGVKMGASHTKVLTEGPRPPLGVVTLDDGATLTVAWPTVIGRDPSGHDHVVRELAAPFVVSDDSQSVSRSHALIELDGWDVLVSDLGSRNGTFVQQSAGEPRRRLAGGERIVLRSGTIVHLGERSFVFHEHHVR